MSMLPKKKCCGPVILLIAYPDNIAIIFGTILVFKNVTGLF